MKAYATGISLRGVLANIPSGRDGGAFFSLALLRSVFPIDLAERKGNRLGGCVIAARRAAPLDALDKNFFEIVGQVLKSISAGLAQDYVALGEMLAFGAVQKQCG